MLKTSWFQRWTSPSEHLNAEQAPIYVFKRWAVFVRTWMTILIFLSIILPTPSSLTWEFDRQWSAVHPLSHFGRLASKSPDAVGLRAPTILPRTTFCRRTDTPRSYPHSSGEFLCVPRMHRRAKSFRTIRRHVDSPSTTTRTTATSATTTTKFVDTQQQQEVEMC